MAVTAAVQLGYLGTHGLREVATRCAQGAHYAFDELVQHAGIDAVSTQPFFREFTVVTKAPAELVLRRLADEGFLGGLSVAALAGESDGSVNDPLHSVVVAVTEKRTKPEIDAFVTAFAKAVN
jgi:glycine cleavage system pyridoxal-binding protein P